MQVANFFKKLKPYYFRLLAGVLFCVLLLSTWFLFSQKPDYPEEIHISLQEQLKHIIQEAFYNKEEGVHNLQFQKMQTSVMVRSNRIKAEFKYSFMDKNNTKVTVVGVAQMKRNYPDSETKHDIWLMDHFETKPPVLEFHQPIVLLSSKKEKLVEDDNENEENLNMDDNSLANDENIEEHLQKQEEDINVKQIHSDKTESVNDQPELASDVEKSSTEEEPTAEETTELPVEESVPEEAEQPASDTKEQ